ncbi:expressed unknown protein [Seminavis robusta]|uniref:Uncharacterized protein n=1 Tax=Seminavis robusta TaxID=568900 RepID=A0A9N8HP51_9STRA|nr:expressed unknown protein [Seminavis robusta]|eukprot:Sro874_g214170.1 n/a (1437) ;mRNA; r:9988-14298
MELGVGNIHDQNDSIPTNVGEGSDDSMEVAALSRQTALENHKLQKQLERQKYEHEQQQLQLRQEQLRQQEQLRWQQHQLQLQQEQLMQQEHVRSMRQQQQIRNQKLHHQQRHQYQMQQKQLREQQQMLERQYQQQQSEQQDGIKRHLETQRQQQEEMRQREQQKEERKEERRSLLAPKLRRGRWQRHQQLLHQLDDEEESLYDLRKTITVRRNAPSSDASVASMILQNVTGEASFGGHHHRQGVTIDVRAVSEALSFLDRASRLQIPEHLAATLEILSKTPRGEKEQIVRKAIAVRQGRKVYGDDYDSLQQSFSKLSYSSGFTTSYQPVVAPNSSSFGLLQKPTSQTKQSKTSALSVSSSSSRSLGPKSTITSPQGSDTSDLESYASRREAKREPPTRPQETLTEGIKPSHQKDEETAHSYMPTHLKEAIAEPFDSMHQREPSVESSYPSPPLQREPSVGSPYPSLHKTGHIVESYTSTHQREPSVESHYPSPPQMEPLESYAPPEQREPSVGSYPSPRPREPSVESYLHRKEPALDPYTDNQRQHVAESVSPPASRKPKKDPSTRNSRNLALSPLETGFRREADFNYKQKSQDPEEERMQEYQEYEEYPESPDISANPTPLHGMSIPGLATESYKSEGAERHRHHGAVVPNAATPLHRNVGVRNTNERDPLSPTFGLSADSEDVPTVELGEMISPSTIGVSLGTSAAGEDMSFPSLKISEAISLPSKSKPGHAMRREPSPSPSDVLMTYTVTENGEDSSFSGSNPKSRFDSGKSSAQSRGKQPLGTRADLIRQKIGHQPDSRHSRPSHHTRTSRQQSSKAESRERSRSSSNNSRVQSSKVLRSPSPVNNGSEPPFLPPSSRRSLYDQASTGARGESDRHSSDSKSSNDERIAQRVARDSPKRKPSDPKRNDRSLSRSRNRMFDGDRRPPHTENNSEYREITIKGSRSHDSEKYEVEGMGYASDEGTRGVSISNVTPLTPSTNRSGSVERRKHPISTDHKRGKSKESRQREIGSNAEEYRSSSRRSRSIEIDTRAAPDEFEESLPSHDIRKDRGRTRQDASTRGKVDIPYRASSRSKSRDVPRIPRHGKNPLEDSFRDDRNQYDTSSLNSSEGRPIGPSSGVHHDKYERPIDPRDFEEDESRPQRIEPVGRPTRAPRDPSQRGQNPRFDEGPDEAQEYDQDEEDTSTLESGIRSVGNYRTTKGNKAAKAMAYDLDAPLSYEEETSTFGESTKRNDGYHHNHHHHQHQANDKYHPRMDDYEANNESMGGSRAEEREGQSIPSKGTDQSLLGMGIAEQHSYIVEKGAESYFMDIRALGGHHHPIHHEAPSSVVVQAPANVNASTIRSAYATMNKVLGKDRYSPVGVHGKKTKTGGRPSLFGGKKKRRPTIEDEEDLDRWLETAMASKSVDDGCGIDARQFGEGDEADLDAWLDNVICR